MEHKIYVITEDGTDIAMRVCTDGDKLRQHLIHNLGVDKADCEKASTEDIIEIMNGFTGVHVTTHTIQVQPEPTVAIINNLTPVSEMWKVFVPGEEPDQKEFMVVVGRCISSMFLHGSKAVKPRFFMGRGEIYEHCYKFYFCAEDLNKPRKDEFNLHGNNTSQVLYNGAIIIDRKIKRSMEVYDRCHHRTITGSVTQLYDPEIDEFVSQSFIAKGSEDVVTWKNSKGEPIDDPSKKYLDIRLNQPANGIRVHT